MSAVTRALNDVRNGERIRAETAEKQLADARKALERIREEDWSEYEATSGTIKIPGKGAMIAITALDDLPATLSTGRQPE